MAAPVFAWDPTSHPGSPQAQPRRCDWPVSLLRLDGPDGLRFLHGQTSQALEQAQAGQWLSTCCITPTARLRALAEVLVDGEGATLVIRAGEGEAVRTALDRVLFPADAVHLGPLAAGLLVETIGIESDPQAPAAGRWAPLAAPDRGWRLGSHLTLLPAGQPLPAALAELKPLSPQEQDHWRLGQGLPVAPNEVNEDTNPFELGLADRVSLSKGCYVGQETLAKLATYDGVKRQLRRWICLEPQAEDAGLAPGTTLWAEGAEPQPGASPQRAGVITSSLSLDGGRLWIGLALVRRQALELGRLRAGEGSGAPWLELSLPERFVAPPVGAGSTASRP
ncbi:MAG: folate-binding protein [Cyanobacteria bacterium]|nr:folate-binding protein [Cyanobacteriota bacterium]